MNILAQKGIHLLAYFFAIAFLFAMPLSSSLHAEEASEDAISKKGEPIRISSDLMETENRSRLVIFRGNVVAVRGDLTINSDQLRIVNFQSSGNMEKMIAEGNVRLNYKGRVALAEKAIYYSKEEKVELLGNPRAWEGDNQVRGEIMLLFLQDDRSIVKGNEKVRVHVVYYPGNR